MTTLKLTTDSGLSPSDGITNVASVDVGGLAAGSTWQYSVDAGASWRPGSGGSFALAASAYAAGDIQAKQIDSAGIAGSPAVLGAVTIDLSAPEILTLSLMNDNGVLADDNISNDGSLSIGSLEDDARVEYRRGGAGAWTTSFAPSAGANSIQVRQTDVAGNVSNPSDLMNFTLDRTIPALTPYLPNDTGGSSVDGISSVGDLALRGAGQESITVAYQLDGDVNWQDSVILTEGTHTVRMRQTSIGGNFLVNDYSFTVDTAPPVAPLVKLKNDNGLRADDFVTNSGLLVVATESTAATVAYSNNAGAWTTSFVAVEGVNDVQLNQTDAAGNVSDNTSFSFVLDTRAPAPLTILATVDSGVSDQDMISNDPSMVISTPEDGATIQYCANNGAWTAAFPTLKDGANSLQVRAVDLAGNASAASAAYTLTLDTVAAPLTLALAINSGISPTDWASKFGTVNVTGIEAGASWQYSTNGGVDWVPGVGNSFKLDEDVYSAGAVRAMQTDIAGNSSLSSVASAVTIDATIPDALVLSLRTDSGSPDDDLTNDGTLAFSAETGAKLSYSVDNGKTWLDNFTPREGANAVLARQMDVAGNVSSRSAVFNFVLDTLPPALSLALARDTGSSSTDRVSSEAELLLVGAGADNLPALELQIAYRLDGAANWVDSVALTEGRHTVSLRETDTAGNTVTKDYVFTIDTVSPAAPVLSEITPTPASGKIPSFSLALSGIESNAKLEYSLNSGPWVGNYKASSAGDDIQVQQIDLAGNVSDPSVMMNGIFDARISLGLLAYGWKSHDLLGGALISGAGQNATTGLNGAVSLANLSDTSVALTVSRANLAAESATVDAAVNLQDAIAILKMIVGLDVNGAGKPLSPYQSYAADFDGNGKVELSDAINVLKHVVGLASPDPAWLFFNEALVPPGAGLNPGIPPAISAVGVGQLHFGLVGVLRGDVDGSFGGAAGSLNLDVLQPSYIHDLALQPGLNLSQFGVYGP